MALMECYSSTSEVMCHKLIIQTVVIISEVDLAKQNQ